MTSKKFMERVFVPLFIIGLCIFFWTQLSSLPEPRFEPMGAALYPKVILGSIIFLTILDIILSPIEDRRKAKQAEQAAMSRQDAEDNAVQQQNAEQPKQTSIWVPVIAILGFIVYILLISYTDIHYSILTFLFITLDCWYLGNFTKRAFVLSALTAFLITGLIHITLAVFMDTILP